MPNIYTACWTMSDQDFQGANRVDAIERVALTSDTTLKIMGRRTGGNFHRMLVVPEYFYESGTGPISRDDKHIIYRKLMNISAKVPDLIIIAGTIAYSKKKTFASKKTYNVCPILHNGQIIKKLYKANDDGVYQNNGAFRTKTDNNKAVPLATINGISIGLDICMDYNNSRLENYLATNNLNAPDVHIQISGTNATSTTRNAARVGGVYIHCDQGGKGVNGASAWRVTGKMGMNATTTRINPSRTETPGIGRLMFFDTQV